MAEKPDWVTAELTEKVAAMIEQVRAVYRENRNLRNRPPVPCPACGAGSTLYACAWGTGHVWFACEACGFRLRQ